MATSLTIAEVLRLSRVIPVLAIEDATLACDVARAFVRGGLQVVEIVLRSAAALSAIEAIARNVPQMRVGAGTVLTVTDLRAAASAGATFAVSPGTTASLLEEGVRGPIPYLPAVATASELMTAMDAGYRCFKFFPASAAGGTTLLEAWAAPFPAARFFPTGGITPHTLLSYLRLSNVLCVGGSWLAPPEALAARDWARIEALTKEAVHRCASA
jgi:2-dehydro-3-deoxyphosphogluconate aldolase/(4S)-4-hydroxy-2-oxoglutarate aldolase